ncbi:MAG: hypothetical protein H7296_03050 [Bacteroidia bacterium]|nr:hypothetical protein [Bacteroidia bacterium]
MTFWNPGVLPQGLTVAHLKKSHTSQPRNKLIAEIFYNAGLVERWGYGTVQMVRDCIKAGLPEPFFEEHNEGMLVTFAKDIYAAEYLSKKGVNERQIKGILHMKKSGSISNQEYQRITGAIRRTSSRDLAELLEKDLLVKTGSTGKGTTYTLRGHIGDKGDIKEATNIQTGHEGDKGDMPDSQKRLSLDAKLKLLEKELHRIDPDKTRKEEFNQNYLIKALSSWLGNALKKIVPVGQKFNHFFKEKRHEVYLVSGIAQVKFTNESAVEILRMLIDDSKSKKATFKDEARFEITFTYLKFKKEGLKPVSISQQFTIEFTDIYYKVYIDEFVEPNGKQRVQLFEERLLHKGLTNIEINELSIKFGESLFNQLDFYTRKNGIRENNVKS